MRVQKEQQSDFFTLISAGLWEKDIRLPAFDSEGLSVVYQLAQEQAVIGLLAAGLEHLQGLKLPKEQVLQIVGEALQIEQRNSAMNYFIGGLIEKMRAADIYTLLVKGQGIAQCYERPLWRACGDVDFYLSKSNYEKAKEFLAPLASNFEPEDKRRLHFGMTIDSWVVELHGTMHSDISFRINAVLDEVHHDIFYNGNIRSWNNNSVTVFLPDANNGVIIIFTHFINHFYGEGIGLRQICDWCRLLWKYKDEIDVALLEKRLKRMKLMKEWMAFGAFAVEYLGMPIDAIPLYSNTGLYRKKAKRLCSLIIETGNFGHNKDNSYRNDSSKIKINIVTFFRRFKEFSRIATIFPVNTPRYFITYVLGRVKAMI